ncbi:hypothetical protein CDAR_169871 [Caerostris darwini]|uniref:Uncharacterized protein n=1 Tax=Caerostris darwini TaxID=1538125 RepID=A0AAV4TT10_9ARAC|nr:hypothetical protein CDAR_169871 [Caerostris darwini]
MPFLAKGWKKDLATLATELGEKVEVIDLRGLIMKTPIFTSEVEFVQTTLNNIIAERLENEAETKAAEQARIAREKAAEKAEEQK